MGLAAACSPEGEPSVRAVAARGASAAPVETLEGPGVELEASPAFETYRLARALIGEQRLEQAVEAYRDAILLDPWQLARGRRLEASAASLQDS